MKTYLTPREGLDYYQQKAAMDLYLYAEDKPIAGMYPEIWGLEEVSAYVCIPI